MIKKYEDACREAGLSEEKIKEIRQIFDSEKKRNDRRKKAIERAGLSIFSLSYQNQNNGEEQEYEIADDYDLEEEAIKNLMLEELAKVLDLLEPKDRDFILMCFDPSFCEARYAKQIGVARQTIQGWKDRIVRFLREKMSNN